MARARTLTVVVVLLATLLLPSAASATVFTASGTDAPGDAEGFVDVVGFTASYDDASGALSGSVTLAGTSTTDALVFVAFGTKQADGSCAVAWGLGASTVSSALPAVWGPLADVSANPATRTFPAPGQVGISGGGPAVAGKGLNCAQALSSIDQVPQDRTDAATLAAPAAPTPTPTAAPPAPTVVPTPTRPAPPSAAQLTLDLGTLAPLARNRWKTVSATVKNVGGTPAAGARLTLSLPRGVDASLTKRALGTLAAGAGKTVKVRLRLTGRAHSTSTVHAKATADGTPTASQTLSLKLLRRVAALTVSVSGAKPVARGAKLPVRVTVANTGVVAATAVKLSVAGPGVTASPKRVTIGRIAAAHRRTLTVKLALGSKAPSPANVRFSVTGAKHLKARQSITLQAPTAPTAPGVTAPATNPNDLSPRMYLHYDPGVIGLSRESYTGYAFVNAGWAYRGVPAGGLPNCTARSVDANGEGCVPYTYDASTGALTIDGQPATLSADKDSVTVGDESSFAAPLLPAGSRIAVSLQNIAVFGLYPNQVITTTWVTLTADGQFAFSSSSLGTAGAGAPTASFVAIAPDHKGTYTILPGSAIKFDYADGTSKTQTLVIDGTPDGGGTPDPQTQGILLNGTRYYASS